MSGHPSNQEHAIYVISVAAQLAGVHPQTLRVYERKGLVQPSRTAGNTRRYSDGDIVLLRRIQDLTADGINLAGVERILDLEDRLARFQELTERLTADLEQLEAQLNELMAGRSALAIVPARDVRRIRRAMKSDQIDRAGQRRVFTAGPAEEVDREK